jgi:hypothetical protein
MRKNGLEMGNTGKCTALIGKKIPIQTREEAVHMQCTQITN